MSMKHPQFHYWNTILQLELMVLQLIRATLANFDLYVTSLQNLSAWFFIYGSYQWSFGKWLTMGTLFLVSSSVIGVYCAALITMGTPFPGVPPPNDHCM